VILLSQKNHGLFSDTDLILSASICALAYFRVQLKMDLPLSNLSNAAFILLLLTTKSCVIDFRCSSAKPCGLGSLHESLMCVPGFRPFNFELKRLVSSSISKLNARCP